jgi:nicotinate-nucleotide pyrophosphorylase (carboxylating)
LLQHPDVRTLLELALREDVGPGDITTATIVPRSARAEAVVVAREAGVLAGLDLFAGVFQLLDSGVEVRPRLDDGQQFGAGAVLAEVEGSARAILTAERTALNFLWHLCGMATITALYVAAVEPSAVRVVDTRKTVPGWRVLSKYAVRVGGGQNHRFGLYDGVLIKDNHIAVAGSVRRAVEAARRGAPHTLRVQVEADTLQQVEEALQAGADAVLLDNMPPDVMRLAVEKARGRALTEASGGIRLEQMRAVAETGVDIISTSAITIAARPIDIALDITTATGASG